MMWGYWDISEHFSVPYNKLIYYKLKSGNNNAFPKPLTSFLTNYISGRWS
jgi:hypothetical protein